MPGWAGITKNSTVKLIDTHAHIYSEDFGNNKEQIVQEALQAGISPILMPAIDSTTHDAMLALEERFPGECLPMMGLHPCSVKAGWETEMRLIEEYLAQNKFVAIGETGLDFYWDLTFKEQQYAAFRRQAELARDYQLPIVIHSRNSTDECIEVIREMQDGRLTGVFHCFSGTVEQAKRVMELGFYLGIGGVVTFKNSGLDAVLRELDLSRIVLETDAPYLAPVPYRGKQNKPSLMVHVAQKVADIQEMSVDKVAEVTTQNAKNLFRL